MDIRRLTTIKDVIYFEGGQAAYAPVTRVAACGSSPIRSPVAPKMTSRN